MRSTLINIPFRQYNDVVQRLKKIGNMHCCYSTRNVKPELTSIRYKMQRGPYATISNADIRFFESLVGSNRLITDPDECEGYNIDFPKTVRGKHLLFMDYKKKCGKYNFNILKEKRMLNLTV